MLQALRRRSHWSGRLLAGALGAAALVLLGASAAAARTGYVSNMSESGVTPINLATNTAGTPIEVAKGTNGYTTSIAITPNGKLAYAPINHKEVLTPINLATGIAGAQIRLMGEQVAIEPEALAISPDGKFVWVANEEGNAVSVVEVATNEVKKIIPVGCEPESVAFTPNGKTVYVGNKANVEGIELPSPGGGKVKCEGTVSVIDAATYQVVKTIRVGLEPEMIAITPNGEYAYVANGSSGTVSKIDTATNDVVATIKVGEPAHEEGGDGLEPTEIAIAPNGLTAYVSDTQKKGVVPIDLATDAVGPVIPVGAGSFPAPRGLGITPNGKTLYVADEEGEAVTPINLETDTAETPIHVAGEPDDVAIVPDQGPTAAFSGTVAAAGAASTFNGASSSDLEGKVTSYEWNFGDGTTTTTSTPTVSHVYAKAGTYTVTLTVTDQEGCSTALVFTGQTAYCNADPGAQATATATVPAPGTETPGAETPVANKINAGKVPGVARLAASSATVKDGKAQVKLTCTGEGACAGSLALSARVLHKESVKKKKKKKTKGHHGKGMTAKASYHNIVVGKDSFSIAQGQSETLSVPLNAKGASVLRKAGKRGIKVIVKGSGIQTGGTLLLKEAASSHSHKHVGKKAKHATHSAPFALGAVAFAAPFGA